MGHRRSGISLSFGDGRANVFVRRGAAVLLLPGVPSSVGFLKRLYIGKDVVQTLVRDAVEQLAQLVAHAHRSRTLNRLVGITVALAGRVISILYPIKAWMGRVFTGGSRGDN